MRNLLEDIHEMIMEMSVKGLAASTNSRRNKDEDKSERIKCRNDNRQDERKRRQAGRK